jgi:hypothetical protein
MFGKLASLVSYWKVLEVYTLKRFPSNKLPVFGMVFTYLSLSYILHRQFRDDKTRMLKRNRETLENKSLADWSFNDTQSCSSCWK